MSEEKKVEPVQEANAEVISEEKKGRVARANELFSALQKQIKDDLKLEFELILFYGKGAIIPRAVWSEPAEEPKKE